MPIGRNLVALRLYKVLGSMFDDDASREALLTLSELYTAPTSKIKESVPTDDVVVNGVGNSALAFLDGPPPGETAALARRNLRRDIETKLSDGAQKFLKAFGAVDQVCVAPLSIAVLDTDAAWVRNWTRCRRIYPT